MSSYMPIEHSAFESGPILPSLAISISWNALRSDSLSLVARKVSGASNAFQDLVSNSMGTHPTSGSSTEEELVSLVSQPGHHREAENADWYPRGLEEPEDTLERAPNDHDSAFISEADDPEFAGRPSAAGPRAHLNGRIWIAVLVVVVLFLIVVPGLVLGVVTKQLPWGIALCGLIVTVISFFASFYYHLDK